MPLIVGRAARRAFLLLQCLAGLALLTDAGVGYDLQIEEVHLPDEGAPGPVEHNVADDIGSSAGLGSASAGLDSAVGASPDNPDAAREQLQTQAIAEHLQMQLQNDSTVLESLVTDPELESVFADLKENGPEAASKYLEDEELMLKISRKMGGLPPDVQAKLAAIDATTLTIHEAAKSGDVVAVQDLLARQQQLQAPDERGITPLGYAIGFNRLEVVKLLLDSHADPVSVDGQGNSGLHYAAGYGHRALAELLLTRKGASSQALRNDRGQTPLVVATINKHEQVLQLLNAHMARGSTAEL